jgi:ribosome-binding factor A
MKRRAEQVASGLMRPAATALLQANPSGQLTTLTRLQLTDDLRAAHAWVAGWQALNDRQQAAITHAMQMAIRDASTTKFTPRLTIHDDDSAAYAARIAQIIDDDKPGAI